MSRIFLSPSTQERNLYKGGSNEEIEMNDLCELIAPILAANGHAVKIGGKISYSANVRIGNAWGADLYIAVHTNAGGGLGTEVWYRTFSTKGKLLATAIYNRLAPVTISPDRGVKNSLRYGELNGPKAPSCIIEAAFHDRLVDANDIKYNHVNYAKAIAQGIMDIAGGSAVVVTPPKPATPPVVVVKPCHTVSKMPVLTKGKKGNFVKHLQIDLNKHGAHLVVDGDFGNNTLIAVKSFQRKMVLLADGVVGPKTWTKLL
jgi:N-acetylmuramoyl-L-alanine amidase